MTTRFAPFVLLFVGLGTMAGSGVAGTAMENAQTLSDNYEKRAAELQENYERAVGRLYETYHTRMQTQAQAAGDAEQSTAILELAQRHDPVANPASDWSLTKAWWGARYGSSPAGAAVDLDQALDGTSFEAAPHPDALGATDYLGAHFLTLTLAHGNDEVLIRVPQSANPQSRARVSVVRTREDGQRRVLWIDPKTPTPQAAATPPRPSSRPAKRETKKASAKKQQYSFKYEYYLIDQFTGRRYDPDGPTRRYYTAERWRANQLGITLYMRNDSASPRAFRGKLEAGDKTKLLSSTATTVLGRGEFATRSLDPGETGQVDVVIHCEKPHIVDFIRVSDVR